MVTKFVNLSHDVQSKFTTWAVNKFPDSRQQAGFANELDRWIGRGRRIISNLESAFEAAESLPEKKRCPPDEAEAKTIAAGLATVGLEEMLRNTVREMQSLANRARQPWSPEEWKRLWAEFATFVSRLNTESSQLNEIKQLVDAAKANIQEQVRRRSATSADTGRGRTMPTSGGEAQALSVGDVATAGLTKLKVAIEKLLNGIATTQNDLSVPEHGGRRKSLLDHQQDVFLSLQRYENHVSNFCGYVQADEDCQEILTGSGAKGSLIGSRLPDVIHGLTSGAAWCRIWLQRIAITESMTYRLPKEIPEATAKMADRLKPIEKRLRKLATPTPAAKVDFSRVTPEAAAILGLLEATAPALGRGQTIRALGAATGWSEQKVRRIIVSQLGDAGLGVVAVDKGKHGEGEGTQKYSPPHAYSIAPEYGDQVRNFLRGR